MDPVCLYCGYRSKAKYLPFHHCINCEKCKAHYCITEQEYTRLSIGDKANRDLKNIMIQNTNQKLKN